MSRDRVAAIGKAAAIGRAGSTAAAITVDLSSPPGSPRRTSTTTVGRIIPPTTGTTAAGRSATYAELTVAYGFAIDPFPYRMLARRALPGGLTASDRRVTRAASSGKKLWGSENGEPRRISLRFQCSPLVPHLAHAARNYM